VEKLSAAPEPADDAAPAWSLIAERSKLEEHMTRQVNERVAAFVERNRQRRDAAPPGEGDEITTLGLDSR
jgi:hypothetical protein